MFRHAISSLLFVIIVFMAKSGQVVTASTILQQYLAAKMQASSGYLLSGQANLVKSAGEIRELDDTLQPTVITTSSETEDTPTPNDTDTPTPIPSDTSTDVISNTPTNTPSDTPTLPVDNQNAISWWQGEGNANDSIGTNPGTITGGVTFAPGIIGQAFSFNGVDAAIQIPSSASLNPTGNFTIEGWIYPTWTVDNPDYHNILSKWSGEGGWQRTFSFVVKGTRLQFAISSPEHELDGSFHAFDTPDGAITLNSWNYVTAVYEKSTGTRKIYVNGILSATRTDSPIDITQSQSVVTIGARSDPSSTSEYFVGQIDELKFYNRALSAEEINNLYNSFPPTATTTPTESDTPPTPTLIPTDTPTFTPTDMQTDTPTPSPTPTAIHQQSQWYSVASMPMQLGYMGVEAVNGKIYAINGDNWDGWPIPHNEIIAYDPIPDSWNTSLAPMPMQSSLQAASVNENIYTVGGNLTGTDNVQYPVPYVYQYNTETDTWTQKADLPAPRMWLGVTSLNGKIYAIGGTGTDQNNPSYANNVYIYDPSSDSWAESKHSMPTARDGEGLVASMGKIYAIGGFNGTVLTTVEAYDPVSDTWETKSPLPKPVMDDDNAVEKDGKIYVVGGCTGGSGCDSMISNVFVYTVATDSWGEIQSYPFARTAGAVAIVGNVLYSFSGYNYGTFYDSGYAYNLPSDILLSDDFSNGMSQWSDPIGTWSVVDGQLQGQGAGGGTDGYIYAGDPSWTNYSFQSKITFNNGEAEMLFRSTGHFQNEYRLSIWQSGNNIEFSKYQNGQDTNYGMFSSLVPIPNPAVVRVDVVDNTYTFYINDQLAGEYTDSSNSLNSGRIGLGAIWSYSAAFDDVVVKSLSSPSTPTDTPTLIPTDTPIFMPTVTQTYIATPVLTNTIIPTDAITDTPPSTSTDIITDTPTIFPTDLITDTPTSLPTIVITDTPTITPVDTDIPTSTPTDDITDTPTSTPTNVITGTPTITPTGVNTDTPTITPTDTPTSSPLYNPSGGQTVLTTRPTFDWPDTNGAISYTLQAAKNISFSSPIINNTSISSTYNPTIDLPDGIEIYWRVRPNFSNSHGPWSDIQNFISANPPSIPSLSSPANGALVKSYTPTLDWGDSKPGLSYYEIQIGLTSAFDTIIQSADVTNSEYTDPTVLDPNTTYYWQVRALNNSNETSDWSTVWSFRTILNAPTLLTPINNTTPDTLRPTFNWNPISGANKYTIQISINQTFSTILLAGSSITQNFTPSKDLPANTNLYWRVQALGPNGPSAWSQQNFTTPNPPTSSVLISPLNSNISSYEPTLSWKPSINEPAYYQLQISTNSLYNNLILDTKTTTTHYLLPSGFLENLTKYYWRVRAANSNDQFSSWSASAWFQSPGQISGRVINKSTGLGIGGLIIQVKGKNLSATTDSDGNYIIKGIVPDSYSLTPSKSKYLFSPTSLTAKLLSTNLTNNIFKATSLHSVSGKVVLDPRSNLMNKKKLLQSSGVWSLSDDGVGGVSVKDNQGHSTTTDTSGNYQISNALTGNYSLGLTKNGYASIPVNRSYYLSDDELYQYFMVTPLTKPSTTEVTTLTDASTLSFSENGRYLDVTSNNIWDLYTGQTPQASGLDSHISGDGRFFTFAQWNPDTIDQRDLGIETVYVTDRDSDGNGIFDEPGTVETWSLTAGFDKNQYNEEGRIAGDALISQDGRTIVFTGNPYIYYYGESYIDPGSCGDVIIYDVPTRKASCPAQFSVGAVDGISPNGRFIAFATGSNLTPEDQNGGQTDLYIYDRDPDENGIFDEDGKTKFDLVSISTGGQQSTMGIAGGGSMSADGRFVAFSAVGLDPSAPVDNHAGGFQIFIRDRQNRTTKQLPSSISLPECAKAALMPYNPEMTPDGRFIVYYADTYCESEMQKGSNYVPYLGSYIYLHDRDIDQNGIYDEPGKTSFQRVNLGISENSSRYAVFTHPNISADGRFIAFIAIDEARDKPAAYIYDRGTGLSFSITGKVTDGNNKSIPGVTIDAGNGRTAYTDQDGLFSLVGMPGGTYYLNPSGTGLTFSPPNRAVVVPPNSTSQNFTTTTGYVKLSSLSGRVADVYGHPLIGVAMDNGKGQLTTTDDQGFYSFTDLPDGQYTITPTEDGYEFHPLPVVVNVQGENIDGLNYTGLKIYNISGRVTDENGVGIEGVEISDIFGDQFTTNKDGYYTISGIPVGGYTLTAIKPGYTFDPDWQYVEVDTSDVNSVNFVGQGP